MRDAPDVTDDELVRLFDRLPDGFVEVQFARDRWALVGARRAAGASRTFTARRLADDAVVGANLYLASTGARLRSCEVPDSDVLAFLAGFRIVGPRDDGSRPLVRTSSIRDRLRLWWFRCDLRRRGLLSPEA